MSDSVLDTNEIAAVIANAPCLPTQNVKSEHHANCQAAAVVAWLDERIFAREYRGDGSINAVIFQPEDQHG